MAISAPKTSASRRRSKRSWWQRLKMRPFFIRWSNWEFWPMWLTSIPTIFYWLWLSLRARTLFWFSAANPGIHTGGMVGESKNDIHNLIPEDLMPATIFVPEGKTADEVWARFQQHNFSFPVIVKPDMGGRGAGVRKINSEAALREYATEKNPIAYHIQEYIDYEVEAGVMHYQMPDSEESGIISVTIKRFLTIVGDGESTLEELAMDNPRAILVMDSLREKYADRLEEIIPEGEKLMLEPIGNHCRGTMFADGSHLINEQMVKGFDAITSRIDGVYFSRYDLRCPSIEDLQAGRNIMILEINGVGADPAHVFDPAVPFFRKYRDIFRQWKIMFRIARANRKKGIKYMTYKEVRQTLREVKAYQKKLGETF